MKSDDNAQSVLMDQDKLQRLSSWPLTSPVTYAFHQTYSANRVNWTASDEKHGNIAEGIIHEDSAVHFSDRVTTLCKARGSWVPQSAQGTVKPTARSAHGPLCPKDRGKVVGTARSFGSPAAVAQKDLSLFMTGARLQCPTVASMIHGQILTDSSQPRLFEALLSVKENIGDWRRWSLCWQRFRPVQVMCELVTRSKDEIRWGLVRKTKEWGSPSDKWSLMWRGLSKFDKNPKLGHGFLLCLTGVHTFVKRNPVQSVFSSTIGT